MKNCNWFWCPKCKEAVPQLSPDHHKGECHCEHRKTGKHVDMILVPSKDKRVLPIIARIMVEMANEKVYLFPFHMRVHTGLVQHYVRVVIADASDDKKDSYFLGTEFKGGHTEAAIDKELYAAFCKTALMNRAKMGFRCRDNPKCPGNDKEFRMVP